MMRKTLRLIAAVVTSVVAVIAIGLSLPVSRNMAADFIGTLSRSGAQTVPIVNADLSGTGPGSLLSAVTMPGLASSSAGLHQQSARVVYRSTSGDDGSPTVVSGAVFKPLGAPPSGGWPVVAFGHGTTGIDEPCGPSLSPDLMGVAGVVAGLTGKGFAVVMPDYEGLGAPGVHPYTDAKTAGLNLIDAVRALHRTFGDVSNRWAALAHSQGGGAAWAADERAKSYAPELDLVGAVALAPAADVTGFVDKAQVGTLTQDQRLAFTLLVESLARRYPDVNRDDYRRGAVARSWDVLTACSGPLVEQRPAASAELSPRDISPSTPEAADRLRGHLARWALPQEPLSAPMYVVYGSADTLIDPQWTTGAIARACALGGNLEWELQPGKGHGDIDFGRALTWILERFAGRPATNDCR